MTHLIPAADQPPKQGHGFGTCGAIRFERQGNTLLGLRRDKLPFSKQGSEEALYFVVLTPPQGPSDGGVPRNVRHAVEELYKIMSAVYVALKLRGGLRRCGKLRHWVFPISRKAA